jgi:DNA-binding PadR family transcriptional regulator
MKQLYMFDNRLNYRVLKERIEGIIGSVISDGTLSRHLQKMENDRLLNKVDAGRGGKVFYSLTIECKKKEQLHLLKFNPQYELFRGIYAYTFLCGMPDENSYASDNLQDILSEIHARMTSSLIEQKNATQITRLNHSF